MTDATPNATHTEDAESDWHRAERRLLSIALRLPGDRDEAAAAELYRAALEYQAACAHLRALDDRERR